MVDAPRKLRDEIEAVLRAAGNSWMAPEETRRYRAPGPHYLLEPPQGHVEDNLLPDAQLPERI